MTKPTLFTCTIKSDIFPSTLNIGIGDMELFKKYIKKHASKLYNENGLSEIEERLDDFDGSELGWFIPTYIYSKHPDINTLVHELLHFTIFEFKRLGLVISDENDEAFCYYVGSFLERIVVKITKQFGAESLVPNKKEIK
ncbi:MAG: hypothetical protein M0R51_15750 [Clostridia bacterium]|jgi:hypothetical protein|nr:hypothetical protein [Clostridia bacterium]